MSAGQMDSHQRKSSPAESSRPAPPPTLVRAQQHELENLRALPRRELQALAKRFKIKANAKSADIINQLMNCESFSQTSSRTDHYTKESDEPDDNAFDANADISKGLVNLAAVNSSAAAAPAAASAVPHTATTICMGKRDAATARDNQTELAEGIFSELTTRTIFRPNHEPAVIKCRIPQLHSFREELS